MTPTTAPATYSPTTLAQGGGSGSASWPPRTPRIRGSWPGGWLGSGSCSRYRLWHLREKLPRFCGCQKRAGPGDSRGLCFVRVCVCLVESTGHAGVIRFRGCRCPRWVAPLCPGCMHTCVCTQSPRARRLSLTPPPPPPMGALASYGACVPILRRSALEFRPLPACSLLANYKLSDLYSLTSTRQRQARQTSVGDMPPSTGGLHFS